MQILGKVMSSQLVAVVALSLCPEGCAVGIFRNAFSLCELCGVVIQEGENNRTILGMGSRIIPLSPDDTKIGRAHV